MSNADQLTDTDLALRLARALGWLHFDTNPDYPYVRLRESDPAGTWHTPFWLLSADGMLAVLEAMRERDYEVTVDGWAASSVQVHTWSVEFDNDDIPALAFAHTLPRAVAEAALAALEAERE